MSTMNSYGRWGMIGAIAAGLLFSTCTSNVKTLYDPTVDFSKYKSWCWMQGCEFTFSGPAYLDDSLAREHIKKSIEEEMTSRGLTRDEDNPGLLLDFHVTVTNESAVYYHPMYENELLNRDRDEHLEEIHYLKGTLIIDMADREEGRMVWRSVAVGYYDIHPDLTEKNIHRGIASVLKNFPPKAVPGTNTQTP